MTGSDQVPQGFESGRVGSIGSQFEQAVDEHGAEQLRRTSGGINDLPGSSGLLGSGGLGPRLGTVDAVQCGSEIANDMTLAGEKLVAPLASLVMAPGPLLSSVLRR